MFEPGDPKVIEIYKVVLDGEVLKAKKPIDSDVIASKRFGNCVFARLRSKLYFHN